MTSRIIFTSVLLAVVSPAHSQTCNWIRQNPLPAGSSTHLFDVCMVGSDTVFIVGANGEMGRSFSGGAGWNALCVGTAGSLWGVSFVDGHQGWVVGDNGFIAATTDGGDTWQQQTSGTAQTLRAVAFVDLSTGYAVGDTGTVLRTWDGGDSWWEVTTPATGQVRCLFFLNADTGWIGGAGIVARTNDGGGMWETQQTNQTVSAIYFADPDTGWLCGQFASAFYTTFDGGSTWTWSNTLNPLMFHSYDLHFLDTKTGWAIGSYQVSGTNFDGIVARTDDGGVTWTEQEQYSQVLTDCAFHDSLVGWAVGNYGALLGTEDGGVTWSEPASGLENSLYSVFFVDSLHGWACGGSSWDSAVVLHSSDGGSAWEYQDPGSGDVRLTSVFFVDTLTGWVAGQDGVLRATLDGGASWVSQYTGSSDLACLFFVDPTHGWAVGSTTLRTTNGGSSWSEISSPASLNGVCFLDTLRGFAVGGNGGIYRTGDAGDSWESLGDTSFGTLIDVHFIDETHGWITGDHKILMTPDNGSTWRLAHEEWTYTLAHSFFTDTLTGYAVTRSNTTPFPGHILKTIDGGVNWQREYTGNNGMLSSAAIHFVNSSTGWVAGGGGTILKTVNGGGVVWSLPDVTVTAPVGGESWEMGTGHDITWSASDNSQVVAREIWLSIDNGKTFTMIDSAAGNSGTWSWNVGADTASEACLVEVRAYDDEGYMGKARSAGVFAIFGEAAAIPRCIGAGLTGKLRILSSDRLRGHVRILFSIPDALAGETAVVSVHAPDGSLVRTITSDTPGVGPCRVDWDGTNRCGAPAPSGVYWCRLALGAYESGSARLVLVR